MNKSGNSKSPKHIKMPLIIGGLGEPPVPSHPKLIHYVTRRRTHLYKLSMVSAIDRSNALILTKDDFNRARVGSLKPKPQWPKSSKPARPMPTPLRWRKSSTVKIHDGEYGVSEQKIIRFARDRLPIHSIHRVVDILERSGQIHLLGIDRTTKIKYFTTDRGRLQ